MVKASGESTVDLAAQRVDHVDETVAAVTQHVVRGDPDQLLDRPSPRASWRPPSLQGDVDPAQAEVAVQVDVGVARDADAGRRARRAVDAEQLEGVGVARGRRLARSGVGAEHQHPDDVARRRRTPGPSRSSARLSVVGRTPEPGTTIASTSTTGSSRSASRTTRQRAGSRRRLRRQGVAVVAQHVVAEHLPAVVGVTEREPARQAGRRGLPVRRRTSKSKSTHAEAPTTACPSTRKESSGVERRWPAPPGLLEARAPSARRCQQRRTGSPRWRSRRSASTKSPRG